MTYQERHLSMNKTLKTKTQDAAVSSPALTTHEEAMTASCSSSSSSAASTSSGAPGLSPIFPHGTTASPARPPKPPKKGGQSQSPVLASGATATATKPGASGSKGAAGGEEGEEDTDADESLTRTQNDAREQDEARVCLFGRVWLARPLDCPLPRPSRSSFTACFTFFQNVHRTSHWRNRRARPPHHHQ